MALPSLVTPEHEIEVPSTKQKVKIRPFLVKEEKILLTAQESDDNKDQIAAVKQILKNCILDEIDVENLSYFDFEFLYLNIRARSISNILEFDLRHDCDTSQEVIIDLDTLKIKEFDNHEINIMINDDIGVKMKYPTISNLNLFEEINESSTYDILQQSIEYVYDAENIYDEFTEDEMKTFIESMNKPQIEKLSTFFETMPKLEHKIEYKCKGCKKKVEYTLRGLNDFFT